MTTDASEQHKAELGRLAQLRQQRAQIEVSLSATEGALRNGGYGAPPPRKSPIPRTRPRA
ncbi:MAG: hypothetical protein FJZ38_25080 [Candidatus Rokubacteria bacterium]|nr:hypothetical protein [Candidatus Rokubacteria bacterium]